jgi:environmental stress-induced protein Ves
MTVRILSAADRTPTPWKNGGGLTREIAAHPPGAGMGDFEWRVSAAEVASDGAFSRFEGVDRIITVVAGAGMDLSIAGEPVRLTPDSEPFAFPGDAAVFAHVLAGPVSDLNVMVRRGLWRAEVERLDIETAVNLTSDADACLIFAEHPLSLSGVVALETGDVVRLDRDDIAKLLPRGGAASVLVIELTRV